VLQFILTYEGPLRKLFGSFPRQYLLWKLREPHPLDGLKAYAGTRVS